MRRAPGPLEIIGYVTLSVSGLFVVYEGITDQSVALLVGGAMCIALGLITLVYAISNVLWNRHLLRRSVADEKLDSD